MKKNLPVTDNEIVLKPTDSIVSKTDLKGRITYVNQAFLDISGFTESELINQSHNIVRHPDMPPAAYEDLWKTIKALKTWTGTVKNRCKDGGFYWVSANVTPIVEKGNVTGYMSVRSKPSIKQIKDAESIYKKVNSGKASLGALLSTKKKNSVLANFLFKSFNVKFVLISTILISCLLPLFFSNINLLFSVESLLTKVATNELSITEALVIFDQIKEQTYIVFICATVFIAFISQWLIKSFIYYLNNVLTAMQQIANGQLITTIDANFPGILGDMAENINLTSAKLANIIKQLAKNIDYLSKTSTDINTTVINLSKSADEQANSVEHTHTSLNTIDNSIQLTNQHTQLTVNEAVKSSEMAQDGGKSVTETITAMNNIAKTVSIVEDIAYQINILSLNAAIEAARAGKYGKGFSVVADEVRKLADRSSQAATEIINMVNKGVVCAENSDLLLNQIIPNIENTATLIRKISDEASEQTKEISQINSAMEIVDRSTQQNSSSATELSGTVSELRHEAESLHELIGFFRIT